MKPMYYIGQNVWIGRSHMDGTENLDCPDCLGSGVWAWKSPGGEEGTVECPRCHGRKTLGLRCYHPYVRQLTVGSVRTDTAAKTGEEISYMCNETGVGSGSVYYETCLFYTEEEAQAWAEQRVAIDNANLEEQQPGRAELRSISKHTMKDAMVRKSESDRQKAESRLHRLLERICDLDTHNTVGERFRQDDEFRSCTLEEKQIKPLQESLVWLDDYCADYLENRRIEEEQE